MVCRVFTLFMFALFALAGGCAGNAKKELSPAEKKAKLYYNQGTRNLVMKDYTKALSNLLEASRLNPENSDIHNNLGMAYYFKNSPTQAATHIKKAIELEPKNTNAKLNLATIYLEQGSLDMAEDLYRNILKDLTYEGQQRTHYNLGVIQLRRNNFRAAAGQFNMALKTDPNYCPAHYKLGQMAYKQRRYKKAYKSYKAAGMGTCVDNPEPLQGQIESLIKLKRYPDALAKLKDMQERFAMSKHESYARRTIMKVKALQARALERTGEKNQNARSYSKTFSSPAKEEIKAVDF